MNQKNIWAIFTIIIMAFGIVKAEEIQIITEHLQCPEIEGAELLVDTNTGTSCQYRFVDSDQYNFNKEFGNGSCCSRSSFYKSALDDFREAFENFKSKCKELEAMNDFVVTSVKSTTEKFSDTSKLNGAYKKVVSCEIIFNRVPYSSKILNISGPILKNAGHGYRFNGLSHICTD